MQSTVSNELGRILQFDDDTSISNSADDVVRLVQSRRLTVAMAIELLTEEVARRRQLLEDLIRLRAMQHPVADPTATVPPFTDALNSPVSQNWAE